MNAVIIDDDPTIRRLLARFLLARGYEVASFANPQDCPLYADESCPCVSKDACPDLIISDYDMPGVNGLEFVAHLRKKQCKCANIAMMSGSWTAQDLRHGLPVGVHFFSKPFQFKHLTAWLDRIQVGGEGAVRRPDSRRFVRYRCELPLMAHIDASGLRETVRATARNISRGGMLMECSRRFSPLASFQITFTVPEWLCLANNTAREVMVAAQVRHAMHDAQTYGLQFVEPLT